MVLATLHSSVTQSQASKGKTPKDSINEDARKAKFNHLRYCASTQFFERCIRVCINDDKYREEDQRLYFRTRVESALTQCLQYNKAAGACDTSDIDHKILIESTVKEITWGELFADHNHHNSGHDSVTTAMMEVLAAILNVLLRSNHLDCGAAAIFRHWSYNREKSKDSTVSNSDKIMVHFIGVHFVHDSVHPVAELTWYKLIEICTAQITVEIKSAFTLDTSKSINDKDNIVSAKDESVDHARCWVKLLRDINTETEKLSGAISNSMLMIVGALDNVDISNLDMLDEITRRNRKNRRAQSSDNTGLRKRQKLPHGARSTDIVQTMHDTALDLGDDRRQRAQKALIERESSFNGQVSLKRILNAPKSIVSDQTADEATDERSDCFQIISDAFEQSSRISSLTFEAATFRRELYLQLVQLDSTYIRVKEIDPKDSIESRLTHFVSDLLLRLKNNPSSATKLYTVLTLDHLRQHNLGDRGYKFLEDRLSKLIYLRDDSFGDNGAFYLNFFTEIISECDVYASPRRLIPALSKMMEIALMPSFSSNDHGSIVLSVGDVMLRRKNVLSRLNSHNCNLHGFTQDWKKYKDLIAKMSLEYDDPNKWCRCRNDDKNVELIAILQALGILGLFNNYNEDFDFKYDHHNLTKGLYDLSDSQHSTLRAAHARLGPCPGFNNILTHPTTYNCNIISERIDENSSNGEQIGTQPTLSPFSGIDRNNVLHVIFGFLGYRSLARASQCCKEWRHASKSKQHWLRLYFRKYKSALLEEELLTLEDDSVKVRNIQSISTQELEERILFPASLDGYDWFVIFKNNYTSEKLAKSRFVGKSWKPRICPCVGCNMLICNERHMTRHWGKHLKKSHAIRKKRLKLKSLKVKLKSLSLKNTREWEHTKTCGSDRNIIPRVDTPESMLLHLIFPFLDIFDLTRPVCKLWNQFAHSSKLWYDLYCHHFGEPCTKWLSTSSLMNEDWEFYFRSMYQTRKLLTNRDFNCFGWKFRVCPILGCCDISQSSLDFNLHLTKHKIQFFEGLPRK